MRRFEVKTQEVLRRALLLEGRHAQSRFVHRLHCVRLVGAGQSCYGVAAVFGDHPRTVQRWVREFQQFGIEGLKEKPHPGRHATLADTQMRALELVLKCQPRELGYAVPEWNSNSLRAEILRRFSVSLSRRHCQRLLRMLREAPSRERFGI